MKKVQSILSIIVISILATSCMSLEGQLDVQQAMSAKKKSGFLNLKTSEIQIRPDYYSAELVIKGDKNYVLKLEGHEKILIPIKSSQDFNLPDSGSIMISHNEINQPFDLRGNIITERTESPRVRIIQECSNRLTENHCQKICDKPSSCQIVCKDVSIVIPGHQEMISHMVSTHRDLSIDFLKMDKPEILAHFHGENTQTDRVIDFLSQCR